MGDTRRPPGHRRSATVAAMARGVSVDLQGRPHRRFNPLSGEWVLVSPDRSLRPWRGEVDRGPDEERAAYDPACYLCPGNRRAGGERNPDYRHTFVFTNDFPALLPDTPPGQATEDRLLQARGERGTCRVVCFSPRHDLSLGELKPGELGRVVEVWAEQHGELAQDPAIEHVQIFENRGAMMGASNPHPHCQIWATEHLPLHVMREQEQQLRHHGEAGGSLLADYLALETAVGERLVCENRHFVVVRSHVTNSHK